MKTSPHTIAGSDESEHKNPTARRIEGSIAETRDQSSTDIRDDTIQPSPKSGRKPKPAKISERPGKRSLNLSIYPEDHERLNVHAIRYGMTVSDLVSKLARDHLREFHITRNPNAGSREAS